MQAALAAPGRFYTWDLVVPGSSYARCTYLRSESSHAFSSSFTDLGSPKAGSTVASACSRVCSHCPVVIIHKNMKKTKSRQSFDCNQPFMLICLGFCATFIAICFSCDSFFDFVLVALSYFYFCFGQFFVCLHFVV